MGCAIVGHKRLGCRQDILFIAGCSTNTLVSKAAGLGSKPSSRCRRPSTPTSSSTTPRDHIRLGHERRTPGRAFLDRIPANHNTQEDNDQNIDQTEDHRGRGNCQLIAVSVQIYCRRFVTNGIRPLRRLSLRTYVARFSSRKAAANVTPPASSGSAVADSSTPRRCAAGARRRSRRGRLGCARP